MNKEPKNPSVSPDRRSFFASLRVRTTLLILLVVIPLAVVAVVFFGYQANRIFRTDAEQSLEATARTLDSNVSIWLNLNIKALNQMVTLPDIISLDADRQKPILKLTSAAFPHLYLVHTTDVNGLNIARNDDGENQNYSDRLWYQGAVSGKPVQLQSLVSRTTGNPALLMATAIRDASGAIIGVGSFGGELDDIAREVNAQKVGNTGFAYIVDDTNRVVAHPDPAYTVDLRDLSDYPPVAALRTGTRGLIDFTDVEGIKWIAYVDDIDYSWGVVVQQPEREVLAQARVFWQVTLLVAGVAIGLLSLLTWIIIQRVTAPIVSLTQAATAITAGDLKQRVQIESTDEVGVLGQAFNQMAEQVGGLLQTVQTRSVELEERTRELEASQRVTFAASEHATPDEMLDLVVNLIRDQFDLYHAQVYMVDEVQQTAVLRQSTGYAGRQLLQRKHSIPLDATALVTRVIHTGEAVLVDDVKADPNFLPNPLLPDTRSELVVPLKREGQVIGVMDAQDRNPGRFNPSTTALFQTMADQVTILFENSELLQRVTDQTEVLGIFTSQLRTAADIARRLGTILDPDRLLQEVVELIQSRFGLYHAHIYLLDGQTKLLKLATGSGEVGRVLRERGHSIPLDAEKSLVARAARTRGAVLIADTTLESDFMPNPLLPQTRSELAIPLVVGDNVLGVLDMQDDQASRFTEAERDTFSTLAGLVATSLQNATLFEERKQAEIALANSEQRFRGLFEDTADGVLLLQAGKFIDCNRAALKMLHMDSKEQVVNTSPDEVSPEFQPDGRRSDEKAQEMIAAALKQGSHRFEWIHQRADGVDFPVEVILTALGEPDNPLFHSLWRDISERKQAEAALRESEQRLSEALNVAQMGYWAFDAVTGTFTFNDQYYKAILNTTAEEVGGYQMSAEEFSQRFVAPEDAHDVAGSVQRLMESTDPDFQIQLESRNVTIDGEVVWATVWMTPEKDAEGRNTGSRGVSQIITERKKAETALRTTRASVEQAQDAFFWFDADARFTDVSDRTCEILGYTREQLLEMRVFDVDPDFPPAAWPGLKAQIKQTGSVTMESHHRTQDGRVFPVEITVSYLEFGDEEIYFSIARDIAERKLAEAEIEKRASELQTVAEVSTAAATILDPDQLLAQVVELTKSNFGLYHAHIYLIDETGESLLLAAGAGEAGKQMLDKGWQIAADSATSLVARAFRTREGVIVNDVRAAPDFLPNPLLPDTRSELAVPLIVGERVLGVLDVQSDRVDHFTQQDVTIQTTLAGQIATAIQNARLFEAQMQTDALIRRRAEFDRLVAEVSSAFVNVSSAQIDAEIGRTLEQISKFSNVDRSYVFIFSDDGTHMTNTHEWCASGIAPQIQDLQNTPVTALPWFTERITRPDQVVYLPRVADLPAEAAAEKQIFAEGAIRSLLAVPMIFAGSVAGFMGFDSVRQEREWGEEEINTLKSVGQTMISALQRIRAEAAILQERNFSAAIINSLPGIFYVVDAEANLARWNDRYIAVTGYTPEDLAVIGALGPIAEEDRATVAERIQTVFLEGEAEVETHLATKNGERIPYYLTGRRAEIEGQTYVIGMGIDITDRVAAERAVRESQQMLEIVMNNLPESIFWKDKDLVYIGCNTNFARDAGVDSPEQVIGKTDHDMPWKDQVALYQADDRHVIETGESKVDFEEPQSTPDGSTIWLRTSKLPLYNEQGEAYAVLGAYADVTEQKQAQEQVRIFQSLAENAADGITMVDFEGKITYANRTAYEMLGFDFAQQEMLGMLMSSLANESERERQAEAVRHIMTEGSSWTGEAQAQRKGGNQFDIAVTMFPVLNANNQPISIATILRDITERKQAETALRTTRASVEQAQDAFFWFDADARFTDVSDRTCEILGYTREQLLEMRVFDVDPDFPPAAWPGLKAQIKQTGSVTMESHHRTQDGRVFPVEVTVSYLEFGDEEIYFSIARDITDRKQAEAEIEKRASELQTVAEVSTAASTILEPDRLLGRVVELTKANFGLYHAHIYLIDETGESLLLAAGAGEAGAQMLAQGWQIAADSETSLVARAFRSHEGVIVNDVRAAPDFLPNPLLPDTRSELAVPLIVGERVLGVLDVQSDQVDHFTREDVAIQTTLAGQIATAIENARLFQETRQVDRLKSEFLANMSHELRTPLNSIIGYVQLLLMDLEGEIPEDSYEDMKSVETNSQHLLSLINDVLDLARIEAGRMELHMENINVPNLLDIVKSNNAGLFIDSPLTFSVEAEPDLPQICADQIRITQVLNNLISNAFKFTETGGIIVRAYSVDGEVCIAIEDTGIGIGEKDMDTVFERFRQVDGSFTRRAEGTGLGLSITRLLVELHGGRVTVKSKLGEGSTFTVHLPAATSA